MRRKVSVDAAGWIGFLNPRDILHKEAVRVAQELRQSKARLITTGFVLLEVSDLTDCISFAVMDELGLTEAFTSDQHFTQAGYQKLL